MSEWVNQLLFHLFRLLHLLSTLILRFTSAETTLCQPGVDWANQLSRRLLLHLHALLHLPASSPARDQTSSLVTQVIPTAYAANIATGGPLQSWWWGWCRAEIFESIFLLVRLGIQALGVLHSLLWWPLLSNAMLSQHCWHIHVFVSWSSLLPFHLWGTVVKKMLKLNSWIFLERDSFLIQLFSNFLFCFFKSCT